MKIDRLTRINEQMRREIGSCLFRIIHDPRFDPAAVTITRVRTNSDLRSARVLVSIRDTPARQAEVLSLLGRHHAEIQQDIAERMILKYTPRLTFHLDSSIAEGDRVLRLLSTLGNDGAGTSVPDTTGEE